MTVARWDRMSDGERAAWATDVAENSRLAQGLPPTVEDDGALDRLATLLASASATPARSSAARRVAVERTGIGDAGPLDTRDAAVRGSAARVATVGRSGGNRPASPTTRRRAGVGAPTLQDNAG